MVDLNNPPSPIHRNQSFTTKIMIMFDDFFRFLRNIQKKPVPLQIGSGALGGWITGYFCTKGSKLVAIVVGCSMILIQFCNYRGYIKFHRNQLQHDIDEIGDRIKKELGLKRSGFPLGNEIDDFINKNGFLLSGFIAGILIGYGMA